MATRAHFSVENYQGSKVAQRRQTRNIDEAYQWAKETPDSSVEILDGKGWVKGTAYFSAKHPPSVDAIRKKVKTRFKSQFLSSTNPAQRSAVAIKRASKRRKKKARRTAKTKRARVVASVQYVITARRSKGSPRMMFDGKNFSQRTPHTFTKDAGALKKARELVKRHPLLRKYRVAIETVGKPRSRPH